VPLSRGRKCRFSNNNKMDLKNNFRQLAKDLKKEYSGRSRLIREALSILNLKTIKNHPIQIKFQH